MAAMSNYLENKMIDAHFRGQSYSFPATLYFALMTVAATDAGGGTEVTGAGYARVGVACSLDNFAGSQGAGTTAASSGTSGTTSNNVVVQYAPPTANWGTVVGICIYDAATDGNLLYHGELTNPKTVNNGDAAPSYAAGSLIYQVDN